MPPLDSVTGFVDSTLLPKRELSIGFVMILVNLFFFINADFVFGAEFAATAKQNFQIYLLMLGIALSFRARTAGTVSPDQEQNGLIASSIWSFPIFIAAFLVTSLIIFVFPKAFVWGLATAQSFYFAVVQMFAVGYTEEYFFRGFLEEYLGVFLTNGAFAVYHVSAYEGGINALIGAFFLGLGFSAAKAIAGLMAAWGAHTAWNFKILGVTEQLISGDL